MSTTGESGSVSNWNLPNAITIARILLAPVFLWLLLSAPDDTVIRWLACGLFVLAIATDGIDGAIARARNLVTDLGKILDPIADKVLTGAALVALTALGELPWWVTALILVREVGITLWRFVELRHDRVIPASRGGKAKTIAQSIAISLALTPLVPLLGTPMVVLDTVTMTIATLLTVLTGAEYLWQSWRQNRAGGRAGRR